MTRLPPQPPTHLNPCGAAIPEPEAPAGGVVVLRSSRRWDRPHGKGRDPGCGQGRLPHRLHLAEEKTAGAELVMALFGTAVEV